MESCLRDKNGPIVSSGRNVRIKECDKESKTGPSPIKASNKVNHKSKSRVAEACAKLNNNVIPKDNAPADKSRSVESSAGDDNQKRSLKIIMGGNTVKRQGPMGINHPVSGLRYHLARRV